MHFSFPCLSDDFMCYFSCLAMIVAGKAYYDGVAKIGEMASGSPVSTELGESTIHYINLLHHPGYPDESARGAQVENRKES